MADKEGVDLKTSIHTLRSRLRHPDLGATELVVRAPHGRHLLIGYYDDAGELSQAISSHDGKANVYIGINPRPRPLVDALGYKLNASPRAGKRASASDIEHVTGLLIDVDAIRAGGFADDEWPATDEEHERTVQVAHRIAEWLRRERIPYVAEETGNGCQVVILVEPLPTEGRPPEVLKERLRAWLKRYIAPLFPPGCGAKLDGAVFGDFARIMRCPGTMNVKPNVSDDRPYRRAELREIYGQVPRVDLEVLLSRVEVEAPTANGSSGAGTSTAVRVPVALGDDELLEKARLAKNGERFRRLFDKGDLRGYRSQSEADAALCSRLAFWTDGDAERMDRLFRQSALMRGKWDEPHSADGRSYGRITIENAISRCTGGYGQDKSNVSTPDADPRPAILVSGGKLPEIVDRAEEVLISGQGAPLYQRGGMVVRTVRTEAPAVLLGLKRRAGALLIHPVDVPYLVDRLTRIIRWLAYPARATAESSVKITDCPKKIAETYLARTGEWNLPHLVGVIEAPTLREDGSILDQPGYDAMTGLLFDPGGTEFSGIAEKPSRDDAGEAAQALCGLLDEFPFVTEADLSVAISAIVTALVRRSLRTAPMHASTAPVMRSGKTTLMDIVAMIINGRSCPVMPQASSPADEEKRLLALLMAGDPIVCYDNIDRPFGGAAISQALTQEVVTGRVLGVSKTVSVPTSVMFLATGNNLTLEGDLTTRALVCKLDPQMEHPEERRFKRDLYKEVPAERGRYVACALTILRAYQVAGRPDMNLSRWAGFDEWSDWVRSALVWAGLADPCETRKQIEEADPVRQKLAALLQAWYAHLGPEPRTAAQVVKSAAPVDRVVQDPSAEALQEILLEIAGKGDTINHRVLGKYLTAHVNRIEGGIHLERFGDRSGVALWRVRGLGDD